MSDKDIEDKFRDLIVYDCSGLETEPIIDVIWRLDQTKSVSEIMAFLDDEGYLADQQCTVPV